MGCDIFELNVSIMLGYPYKMKNAHLEYYALYNSKSIACWTRDLACRHFYQILFSKLPFLCSHGECTNCQDS